MLDYKYYQHNILGKLEQLPPPGFISPQKPFVNFLSAQEFFLEGGNISEKFEVIIDHLVRVVREMELMEKVWIWATLSDRTTCLKEFRESKYWR